MIDPLELYSTDDSFKQFVDKYCDKHSKTPVEALLDYVVREVGLCYILAKEAEE